MTEYCDLNPVFFKTGDTASRPDIPPDIQSFYWDYEAKLLYGVGDNMEWTIVSPAFSGEEGEKLTAHGTGVDATFQGVGVQQYVISDNVIIPENYQGIWVEQVEVVDEGQLIFDGDIYIIV